MTSTVETLPKSQRSLQWVRVSDTNPFEWTTTAPLISRSELGDNQVLISNHAVSLNPIDYKMTKSNFANVKLPSSTGYDVSGKIVAIGKNVQNLKVGDEVFGFLNLKEDLGGGAFQEYSIGEVDALAVKPSQISHEVASTLGVAFLSAMDGLRQVNIDSTTTIFIPGGSGGVGHFALQIAKIRGAKQIITSASKDDGIRILKEEYQITDVINHAKENVIQRVFELTNGEGVNLVYDSTYLPSSFQKSTQLLKEGGSWIVLGHFAQEGSEEAKTVSERNGTVYHADIARYWLGPERAQLKTFVQDTLLQGAKWIEDEKLKPFINQIIQLEQVEDALKQIKQGKGGFGKIVVKIL